MPDEATWQRNYGAFEPLTRLGLKKMMRGFERPWSVVGGYAEVTGLPLTVSATFTAMSLLRHL